MPNHIKNKLEFIGDEYLIKEMVEKFGTIVPEKYNRASDNSIICRRKSDKKSWDVGWFDEETKIFSRRNEEDVVGLPYDWVLEVNKAFIHFPDFNKIKPMPSELNISSDGFIMPLENEFSEYIKFKEHIDKLKNYCEKLSEEEKEKTINNMFNGIRNYINYGHASWYNWSIENWGTKWNSYSCDKISENIFTFETAWSNVAKIILEISKEFPNIKIIYSYSDEDTGYNCGIFVFENGKILDETILENGSKEAYDLALELRPEYHEYYEFVDGKWRSKEEDEE